MPQIKVKTFCEQSLSTIVYYVNMQPPPVLDRQIKKWGKIHPSLQRYDDADEQWYEDPNQPEWGKWKLHSHLGAKWFINKQHPDYDKSRCPMRRKAKRRRNGLKFKNIRKRFKVSRRKQHKLNNRLITQRQLLAMQCSQNRSNPNQYTQTQQPFYSPPFTTEYRPSFPPHQHSPNAFNMNHSYNNNQFYFNQTSQNCPSVSSSLGLSDPLGLRDCTSTVNYSQVCV